MNVEEIKARLKEIFGGQITFNPEFDDYAKMIKNLDPNLIDWCLLIKEEKIRAIPTSKVLDTVVYIKKIGSSSRCIIIKIKNGVFTEVHLGDHDYYNKLRRNLGLKKGSHDN